MEVAARCLGPWLAVMVLLVTDVRPTAASASLRVAPDRQQFFLYETVTFSCESELGGGVLHKLGGKLPQCSPSNQSHPNRSTCTIKSVYPTDNGTYVCVFGGRPGSNNINITVTEANVMLESPALPVMEGQPVSLSCRSKTVTSGSTADFYKDGSHIGSSPAGSMSMSIDTVSKSDEGLYRCSIGGVGESAESWLSVTAPPEAPSCPPCGSTPWLWIVMTLVLALLLVMVGLHRCGKELRRRAKADFLSDGGRSGSEDQTTPEDAAADTGTLAQYPVATKKKSDEDRLTPHSFDAPQQPAESEYYSVPDGHEITEECMYSVAEL